MMTIFWTILILSTLGAAVWYSVVWYKRRIAKIRNQQLACQLASALRKLA